MNELAELAQQTLTVLDLQQKYFKATTGSPEKARLLKQSKQAEKALRDRCQDIVAPQTTATLFDDDAYDNKSVPYWAR